MIKVALFDLLKSFSYAMDMVAREVVNHQTEVAYLAYRLGERMGWSEGELEKVLTAGILHDIGALSMREKLSLIETESESVSIHASRGARLLSGHEFLKGTAEIIRFHHMPWENGGGEQYKCVPVPTESHLIHLADRICALIDKTRPVLTQIPGIMNEIEAKSGAVFRPEFVRAALDIKKVEHIWLELIGKNSLDSLPRSVVFKMRDANLDEITAYSKVFSRIIDFRSRFTATHSTGVAFTAVRLAELMGFSQSECKMMLIAGYLHDLGKLTIDNALLEKPGALNEKEFDIIRTHTFYTYEALKKIDGFETINMWASYHHERLDGTGYPFHLKGENIPLGSRIMAVADIFTALTENRPYREGMENGRVVKLLYKMVESRAICAEVVDVAAKNSAQLSEGCLKSQLEAAREFEEFFSEEE